MATLFTSDSHFGHANIINLCKRPFVSVQEMDEELIERWNDIVKPEDTVYHLGDFAFRGTPERACEIANLLNGKVLFIEGNHDEELNKAWGFQEFPTRWQRLPLYYEAKVEGQKIVMCHYAMRTWHHDLRGVWHLYGHSHGGLAPLGKSVDIGADVWGFQPVSFEKLKAWMDRQAIHQAPKFEGYVPGEACK